MGLSQPLIVACLGTWATPLLPELRYLANASAYVLLSPTFTVSALVPVQPHVFLRYAVKQSKFAFSLHCAFTFFGFLVTPLIPCLTQRALTTCLQCEAKYGTSTPSNVAATNA